MMMYVRYPLSLRNVEDLLFERCIDIYHETVRLWWSRFGPMFASEIRKKRVDRVRAHTHWRWRLDEVYVKISRPAVVRTRNRDIAADVESRPFDVSSMLDWSSVDLFQNAELVGAAPPLDHLAIFKSRDLHTPDFHVFPCGLHSLERALLGAR